VRWSGSDDEQIQYEKERDMRHMRIARYEITDGSFGDLATTAKTGLLPKFRELPGFVRYGVADVGNSSLMSISLWETREQAEAASPVAATWVKDNIEKNVQLRENYVADFAFYAGIEAPAKA
jgi:hypothetical protein